MLVVPLIADHLSDIVKQTGDLEESAVTELETVQVFQLIE